MPNPTRDTKPGQVYNDLRNLAKRTNRSTDTLMVEYVLERFLYRLSANPLGRELAAALEATAEHRGIALRRLSVVVGDLAFTRQAPYTAWLRRQGTAAANHPGLFTDVIAEVTAFADPLLDGTTAGRTWHLAHRTWS